jgi:RNA polymerase sigma factor (sigma-70 family)
LAVPNTGRITPEFLGRLLDEHGGALALYAAQWSDASDDCVQEALIELARQPALPSNVVAWLYRVVRNRAISDFRAARRRSRREELASRLRPRTDMVDRADAALESNEWAAALDALDENLRETIVARIWGGLGFEEIAALAGCSTSTAHRRYEAGLIALRERLGIACPPNATNINLPNIATTPTS